MTRRARVLRYLPVALEVLGFAAMSAAAFVVALPLGLLVAGLSLTAIGVGLDRLGATK
jgi:hypothetical protein